MPGAAEVFHIRLPIAFLFGGRNCSFMFSSFAHAVSVPVDRLSAKLAAYLPMMSKWIGDTSHAPAVHLAYSDNLGCPGVYCPFEDRIRISDRQDHPNSTTAKRLRTEIVILRRFIAQPK